MTAALGIAGGVLALLLFLLLCPVGYRCRMSREGGFAEVRLFGGLLRKSVRWPDGRTGGEPKAEEAEEEDRADEPAQAVPVGKETPLRLDADGTPLPAEEAGEEAAASPPAEESGGKPPGALAVFSYAWDNGTVEIVLRALRKLLRHSRPKTFRLTGRAGLGDPMKTGTAAGLLYALLPGSACIQWDYTGRCFDVAAEARGSVVPLYILYIIGGVLASGPVRRTRAYRAGRPVPISPDHT